MNKKIAINYIAHDRAKHFYKLFFHLLKGIDPELQKEISLHIHTAEDYIEWNKRLNETGLSKTNIVFNYHQYAPGLNYMQKIRAAINLDSEYSVKVDEDCFISSKTWEFMIENCEKLNDKDLLLIAPILSTGIPTCDIFIDNILDNNDRMKRPKDMKYQFVFFCLINFI